MAGTTESIVRPLGFEVSPSVYGPRGIIGEVTVSSMGNTVIRVGNENQGRWEQVAHVVLVHAESVTLEAALARINAARGGTTNTAADPLHLVVADAHHAILDGSDSAVPLIDSLIARLQRAKIAHEAGDKVVASREFDPRFTAVS